MKYTSWFFFRDIELATKKCVHLNGAIEFNITCVTSGIFPKYCHIYMSDLVVMTYKYSKWVYISRQDCFTNPCYRMTTKLSHFTAASKYITLVISYFPYRKYLFFIKFFHKSLSPSNVYIDFIHNSCIGCVLRFSAGTFVESTQGHL